jgi:hypothetical protein
VVSGLLTQLIPALTRRNRDHPRAKDTTRPRAPRVRLDRKANTISLLVARGVRAAAPGLEKGQAALWPDMSTPATSGIGKLIT